MEKLFNNSRYFIFILLVFFSCKKTNEPAPNSSGAVFYFSGKIDGSDVLIEAGILDYYMYSSNNQDGTGLKTYTSNFSKTNCTDCPNSLKFTFIDYDLSLPNSTVLDSTFYTGNYNYATTSGNASRYSIAFSEQAIGGTLSNVNWEFGDGLSQIGISPVHKYVRPGIYQSSMDALFVGVIQSTLSNSINLGNVGETCEANLAFSSPIGTSFSFTGNGINGQAPYTYSWNFGDGNTDSNQNPTHVYANEGVYQVSLTVTDANNLTHVKRQNIRTQNSIDKVANYTYAATPIPNPINLGNVVIEWRDSNGTLFTSKNDSQTNRSSFTIKSIQDYKPNENNQPTKKIAIEFSCTLYNGLNQIVLTNATAVISVAY